jgi:Ca-activated chloride channel family protein
MTSIEGVGARVRVVVTVCSLAALAVGAACETRDAKSAGSPGKDTAPEQGGTGTRAKGEEGAMGAPGLASPAQASATSTSTPVTTQSAASFGMIGLIGHGAGGAGKAQSLAGPIVPGMGGGAAGAGVGGAPLALEPPPHLDPNARYATTYRPGGAALAAFDAAVARGQIPVAYRDLVGDFGARYAPALARPTDGALSIAVDTERTALGPGGGPVNLRVALTSSATLPARAPLSVHIVLDVSGSMAGKAITDAKQAAEAVVDKLDASDDFSMVTFSSGAQVLVGEGVIGPRRQSVHQKIEGVQADGGTNISAGLDLGYAQAHSPGVPADAVRVVMLLSDGHANAGDTDPRGLSERAGRAFQEGVQTSSFGLGADFDAGLMSRIADRGAGGYYYLADSSQIAPALEREVDARVRPVATALELRVRLRPDVAATKVFGSHELSTADAAAVRAQEVAIDQQEKRHGVAADRDTDAAGGLRFFIPAFAAADRHATMVSLQVPAGVGERSIASVEVRYKDRLLHTNVTRELQVKIRFATSDAESAATEDRGIERMVQAFAAGEAILDAATHVDDGDRQGAARLLDERADVLRRASALLKDPRLADDGARVARLSHAIGGDPPVGDSLALAVMLRGSGYGYF